MGSIITPNYLIQVHFLRFSIFLQKRGIQILKLEFFIRRLFYVRRLTFLVHRRSVSTYDLVKTKALFDETTDK